MVINRQRRVRVALRPLEQFVDRVQRALRLREYELTVCLVSDAVIGRLNRSYLGKRGPTDVLSFPADGVKPNQNMERVRALLDYPESRRVARQNYAGDIAISPETARRNARRFSRTLPVEMCILILHGMLHLAGFDHESDNGEMDRLERRLRRRLGVL